MPKGRNPCGLPAAISASHITGVSAIIEWIVTDFKEKEGIDLSGQPDALQRIKEEAEKAKIALSSSTNYDINLPFG